MRKTHYCVAPVDIPSVHTVMKNIFFKKILLSTLMVITVFPGVTLPAEPANKMDIFSGHFSMEGNNESPSQTINNNIYIKIFKNQWIAMLYIPYPYATTVNSSAITKVFEEAKRQTSGSSYLRGTFGQLSEPATIHIEKFGYLEDRLIFECGSLSPCTIRLSDDYLELIKPGVINEHIIKYNHVIDQ
jgi:hypothetical protein